MYIMEKNLATCDLPVRAALPDLFRALRETGTAVLSAAPGDKTRAGVSIENLAECLADCVQKDAYVRQMPVVYNRRQD